MFILASPAPFKIVRSFVSLISSGCSELGPVTQTHFLPSSPSYKHLLQGHLDACAKLQGGHSLRGFQFIDRLAVQHPATRACARQRKYFQLQCHPKQPPKHRGQVQRKVPKRGRQQQEAPIHRASPLEERRESTQLESGHQMFNVCLDDKHRALYFLGLSCPDYTPRTHN